mgnify:CR=1 FL=1
MVRVGTLQEARIEALQHQVNQLHQLLQAKSVANAAMVGDAVGGQPPQVTAYIMQLEDTVERLQQQLGEGVGSSKAHGRAGGAGGATHGGNTTSANKTHGGGTRSRRLQVCVCVCVCVCVRACVRACVSVLLHICPSRGRVGA